MKLEKYRHPFIFYGVAVAVPWTLWFTVGALSRTPLWDRQVWLILGSVLVVLGALAPMVAAFALILPDKDMREELKSACIKFKGIHWGWWVFHFLFPFAAILLTTAISLAFGYSAGQFRLNPDLNFTGIVLLPAWAVMFVAPVIEEFGWHTYGIHCVRKRFNLFTTCFVFGIIWAVWHIPLSSIPGSYQSVVAEHGTIHSINYLVSLIPYLIIDNWTYYKTRRNMFFQVLFHLLMCFSMEIFRTHPDTKIIHTAVLLVFCVFIVFRDRKFFFDKSFISEV
jgi:membrane protease YdiL (CAAX protease family)